MVGNTTFDIPSLKLAGVPKKAAICAWNDVLAASIDNGKYRFLFRGCRY
jgi:hypothetical protein